MRSVTHGMVASDGSLDQWMVIKLPTWATQREETKNSAVYPGKKIPYPSRALQAVADLCSTEVCYTPYQQK